MWRSLSSCLDVVPDATSAWKPEHAPQATVMNKAGNIGPIFVDQPVKAGSSKVALPVAKSVVEEAIHIGAVRKHGGGAK